jgi:pimeloyl-ACP methyl ester carboxylesterase
MHMPATSRAGNPPGLSLLDRFRRPIPSPAAIVCDPQQGDWAVLSRDAAGWGVPIHLHDFGAPGLARPDPRAPPEAAAAMLARLDLYEAPVHLIGRGQGAAVALDVARRRPSRVASLVMVDPHALQLLRPAGSILSRGMRLDVLRRTGFPLLFVETCDAAAEVAMVTRRLHAAARRGRYCVAGSDGASSPGHVWRAVIDLVARQISAGMPDRPGTFARAA